MEPAKIDWKRIDSRFVEDVFYEHIRAPKWFDFLDPQDDDSADDEAWFCRPDSSTPPDLQAKSWKAALKSSSVKKKHTDEKLQNEEASKLKSTLSARNLFGGRDILEHITEFCYELKKLATRTRERETEEKSNEKKIQLGENNEDSCYVLRELGGKEKERKPLLEMGKEKCEKTDRRSIAKEKRRRKKRVDDAENIPISLNLENVKRKGEDRLLQIRTNPPSPQCFSVTRAPAKTTSSKTFKIQEYGEGNT